MNASPRYLRTLYPITNFIKLKLKSKIFTKRHTSHFILRAKNSTSMSMIHYVCHILGVQRVRNASISFSEIECTNICIFLTNITALHILHKTRTLTAIYISERWALENLLHTDPTPTCSFFMKERA